MPGAMKEFMGKGKGISEVPGTRKEISQKEMGAEAKCQEQEKI